MSNLLQSSPPPATDTQPPDAPEKLNLLLPRLVIVVALLLVFFPAFRYDFINLDDDLTLAQNPLMNPPTLHSLKLWWTKPSFELYAPMTETVQGGIALAARTPPDPESGYTLNPWVFHAVNILLHAVVSLLVFQVLLRLKIRTWPACGGALLFAIHPVQVEPVAWITAIKDMLYGTFGMLAIWKFLVSVGSPPGRARKSGGIARGETRAPAPSYGTPGEERAEGDFEHQRLSTSQITVTPTLSRNTGRAGSSDSRQFGHGPPLHSGEERPPRRSWNYGLATLCFVLAMLSKPTAVVLPLIALPLVWLQWNQVPARAWVRLAGWVMLAIPFAIIARLSQPAVASAKVALWERLPVAGDALAFYLSKIVWPRTLMIYYGRNPLYVLQHGYLWWTWIVSAALISCVWLNRRRCPAVFAGMCVFLAGLFPVLGFVGFEFQYFSTVADRYLYLPMLGVALCVAWGLGRLPGRVALLGVVPLAVLAVRSASQVPYWHDSLTLFQHVLDNNPKVPEAYVNVAIELAAQRQYAVAAQVARQCIAVSPRRRDGYAALGKILPRLGQTDEALKVFREGSTLPGGTVSAVNDLAVALRREGDTRDALAFAQLAVELAPGSATYRELGAVLAQMRRWPEAQHPLQSAVSLDPEDYYSQCILGSVLYHLGNREGAIACYRAAESIDPELPAAHQALAQLAGKPHP